MTCLHSILQASGIKIRKEINTVLTYRLTLDSSVSKSIRKRMPTDIRVWYTAFTYLANGMTNSEGLALQNTWTNLSI